ncbi:hypothetical protein [Streptomyces sp. NPDC001781]
MTTTTTTHLRTLAIHWGDLTDALGAPAIHNGFGIGLRGHLAALDELDLALALQDRIAERADSRADAPGIRPIPLRLHILETMRTVEAALIACADDIAHTAQRSPVPEPSARRTATHPYVTQREADIAAADRARRTALARTDQDDPRRWRYTGQRTAPRAALWLLARIERAPGPCRRLTEPEERKIGTVAARTADSLERALDIAAQQRTLDRACECGGLIDVHGGEGRPPLAHCTGCGTVWTEGGAVAA